MTEKFMLCLSESKAHPDRRRAAIPNEKAKELLRLTLMYQLLEQIKLTNNCKIYCVKLVKNKHLKAHYIQ